jgi:hypothetical protein
VAPRGAFAGERYPAEGMKRVNLQLGFRRAPEHGAIREWHLLR